MSNNLPDDTTSKKSKVTKKFQRFAEKTNKIVGSPYWFFFSVLLVLVWFPSGFILGWGEIWHLLINTTTTILTFLMMALLHASQSKWEDRMERLQQSEGSKIRTLEKTAKKLAYQSGTSPEKTDSKEIIESLN